MKPHTSTLTHFLLGACIALGTQFSAPAFANADDGHERGAATMPSGRGHAGLPMPDRPGMREMEHTPPFLRGIELTDEQNDKIFAIMHQQEPLLRDQAKAAHKAHEALHKLASSGQYEEAKAKTLAESGARAMAEIALLHARADQQIHALLTPEQRKRAEAIKAKFEAKFEAHSRHEDGFRPSVEHNPRARPKMPMM